jgi:hypothetical protein
MATVRDCLTEVIAVGSGYVIRTSVRTGPQRTTDWEPSALLAYMEDESPGVLADHAWTEWSHLADGSQTCAIVYGRVGAAPGERGVPGYGTMHAYEARHVQQEARRKDSLHANGFRLGLDDD